ncbi:MAG: hypothetical protein KGI29_07435 [Pseudomonadota bacterium]|nr:hypothetical protein [Pseudomonadota bacterium]MDE3037731.1 hypothetical protein [Pseudomonadota bacterium]
MEPAEISELVLRYNNELIHAPARNSDSGASNMRDELDLLAMRFTSNDMGQSRNLVNEALLNLAAKGNGKNYDNNIELQDAVIAEMVPLLERDSAARHAEREALRTATRAGNSRQI